jgi:Ca2+/Na+ antiporter
MTALWPLTLVAFLWQFGPPVLILIFLVHDYEKDCDIAFVIGLDAELEKKIKRQIQGLRIATVIFLLLFVMELVEKLIIGRPSFWSLFSSLAFSIIFFVFMKKYQKLYRETKKAVND